jgi:hypothetical protein
LVPDHARACRGNSGLQGRVGYGPHRVSGHRDRNRRTACGRRPRRRRVDDPSHSQTRRPGEASSSTIRTSPFPQTWPERSAIALFSTVDILILPSFLADVLLPATRPRDAASWKWPLAKRRAPESLAPAGQRFSCAILSNAPVRGASPRPT